MASKTFKLPKKDCSVSWAKIGKGEIEIGYGCLDESGYGSKNFHATVRASAIHTPGAYIEGAGARVGFVLMPWHVRCAKKASELYLTCRVFKEGGVELAGARSRSRSRMRRG